MTTWKVCFTAYIQISWLADTSKSRLATSKNMTDDAEVDETGLNVGLFTYPVLMSADIMVYRRAFLLFVFCFLLIIFAERLTSLSVTTKPNTSSSVETSQINSTERSKQNTVYSLFPSLSTVRRLDLTPFSTH